jgi:hypothetical protein
MPAASRAHSVGAAARGRRCGRGCASGGSRPTPGWPCSAIPPPSPPASAASTPTCAWKPARSPVAGQVLDAVLLDLASAAGKVTIRRAEAGLAGGRVAGLGHAARGRAGRRRRGSRRARRPAGSIAPACWPGCRRRWGRGFRFRARQGRTRAGGAGRHRGRSCDSRTTGNVGDLAFDERFALAGNGGWTGRRRAAPPRRDAAAGRAWAR